MIPKKIHYFWFGKNEKNDLIKKCINTWKKEAPDYEIIEWNETNYPIMKDMFFAYKMYNQKKWAFVADYARFDILYKYGGIYLDTDMYVLKSLDIFLENKFFIGKEDDEHISAGIIGTIEKNDYILKCKEFYDKNPDIVMTVPRLLTKIYKEKFVNDKNIKIYEKEVFYPFSAKTIDKFNHNTPPSDAYAVHMWNYSWGHPLNRFFKKIGIYSIGKKIVEILGIKKILKNMFGFE